MRKIPTLLVRSRDDRAHVLDEVAEGCEWVLAGEGIPTRKFDGTCVMLDYEGRWWARREVKDGKPIPTNYVPDNHDEVTGKTQGWEPIEQSPFAKFHGEAMSFSNARPFRPTTYELIGPKINGNPERSAVHELVAHDEASIVSGMNQPLTIAEIKAWFPLLASSGWEGVVWHHPDGRMAKLKARDIGGTE